MKPTLAAALCLLAASPAAAERLVWRLSDVEVYGTQKLSADDVRTRYADDLDRLLSRWGVQTPSAQREAHALRDELAARIRKAGGFGWTGVEVVDAGRHGEDMVDGLVVVDVVEKDDMERRDPLRPEPREDVKDTSGLLADWDRYMSLADASAQSSSDEERVVCPAYYCPEGRGGEAMDKLETEFIDEVPGYKRLLLQILRGDADGAKRAKALYLLTYLKDAGDVTAYVDFGLTDPDPRVREAAVTILNDMALHHKDLALPVRDVARMLDYPTSDDRQHALALFLSLSDNAGAQPVVYGPAGDRVLALLRSKVPGVHQMAYTLLTVLSGQGYGERDYDAWYQWLWRARQDRVKRGAK